MEIFLPLRFDLFIIHTALLPLSSLAMPNCAAYGCNNSTAKDPALYFMRFPDDRELCRQWLHNTGRGGAWKPTKHSRLCSEYSEESCFERDLYAELMESDARRLRRRAKRLKADAVPTLFGHTGSVSKAKARRQLPTTAAREREDAKAARE